MASNQSISISIQKKILGKLGSQKEVLKLFLDKDSRDALDALYAITKMYCGSKKQASKLVKYILKSSVKFSILYSNHRLDDESSQRCLADLVESVKLAMKTLTAAWEIDFMYNGPYLARQLAAVHSNISRALQGHVKEKTLQKVNQVFEFYGDVNFLNFLFEGREGNGCTEMMNALVFSCKELLKAGDHGGGGGQEQSESGSRNVSGGASSSGKRGQGCEQTLPSLDSS